MILLHEFTHLNVAQFISVFDNYEKKISIKRGHIFPFHFIAFPEIV